MIKRSASHDVRGESIDQWRREINAAKVVCYLKERLIPLDDRGPRQVERDLANFISWDRERCQVYFDGRVYPSGVIANSDKSAIKKLAAESHEQVHFLIATKGFKQATEYERWERQGLIGTFQAPAMLLAAELVNSKTEHYCSPRITIDSKGGTVAHTFPRNLLGVVWLELFQILTGTVKVRRCLICKKEMNVTDNSRAKRVHDTCSRRERMQRFRAKQREGL